jgi:hypothetical protein
MYRPIELTHHIPIIESNIYNSLIMFMKNKSCNNILILYLNGWSSNLLVTSLICDFFFPFGFLKISNYHLLTSRYLTFKMKICVFFKNNEYAKYCFHYFQKKIVFNLTFYLIFVIIIHFKSITFLIIRKLKWTNVLKNKYIKCFHKINI